METGGRTSQFGVIRSELGQFIAGAIVIALGAGIVASGVVQIFSQQAVYVTILGCALVLVGLLIAIWRVLPAVSGDLRVNILFAVDSKTRSPVSIPRYDFSFQLSSYIKALSSENKALGKAWSEAKFYNFSDPSSKEFKVSATESAKLAVEAIEYFALDTLSTHLTDYFNQEPDADPLKLVEFERNDVPGIFTQNRFVDLFSRPMVEREAFIKRAAGPSRGKVVLAFGPGGARFDHFDLTLPKGAKITRENHGAFSISTNNFTMSVKSSLSYYSYGVDHAFLKYYIGKNYRDVEATKANIDISVRFSASRIFSKSGIQYYRWVDEFLEKMSRKADFEYFLKDIGWETALTCRLLDAQRDSELRNPISNSTTRSPADRKVVKNGDAD